MVLRNLKNASGGAITAQARGLGRGLRGALRRAGIKRRGIYRAWTFTVASERSLAGRMLHIRNDAFAQLGDRNLRDLKVAGKAPKFTIDKVTNLHGGAGPRHRPPGRGHDDRALLPDEGVRARRRVHLQQARPAQAPRHHHRDLHLPDPALGARSRPTRQRRARRCTGTACSAAPTRWTRATSATWRTSTTSCSARRPGPASPPATSETSSPRSTTSRTSTPSADRMQQGFLNMLLLGRLMIHPNGLPSNAAFQKGGQQRDRHAPAVLRRQQPGRHHGRRADRGRAGLHPRRAGRARHELLDAAAAQHRLRHLRPADLPGLPERVDAPADARGDPAAVGPRRGRRLRAAHHHRPRCPTRRRTRC